MWHQWRKYDESIGHVKVIALEKVMDKAWNI
jgi:hypothetical protein